MSRCKDESSKEREWKYWKQKKGEPQHRRRALILLWANSHNPQTMKIEKLYPGFVPPEYPITEGEGSKVSLAHLRKHYDFSIALAAIAIELEIPNSLLSHDRSRELLSGWIRMAESIQTEGFGSEILQSILRRTSSARGITFIELAGELGWDYSREPPYKTHGNLIPRLMRLELEEQQNKAAFEKENQRTLDFLAQLSIESLDENFEEGPKKQSHLEPQQRPPTDSQHDHRPKPQPPPMNGIKHEPQPQSKAGTSPERSKPNPKKTPSNSPKPKSPKSTANAIDDLKKLIHKKVREGCRLAPVDRKLRPEQLLFRKALLSIYPNCLISDCAIVDSLEAAHIQNAGGAASFEVKNGLILRADLHGLFDKGLLIIMPDYRIFWHPALKADPSYRNLVDITKLKIPDVVPDDLLPNKEALRKKASILLNLTEWWPEKWRDPHEIKLETEKLLGILAPDSR